MVPHIQTGFHVPLPYLSQAQYHQLVFAYGAITHYGRTFQSVPLTNRLSLAGCSHFARHYFGNLG